jgi:hypothetical protein
MLKILVNIRPRVWIQALERAELDDRQRLHSIMRWLDDLRG